MTAADRPPTLGATLARAGSFARGVGFVARDERVTRHGYAAIAQRARGVAASLQAIGVAPGDRVGLVLPTGLAFYDALLGVILARAVPVPLYPPIRLGLLDEYHARTAAMLAAVDARLALTDARIHRILGRTVAAVHLDLGCRDLATMPPAATPAAWPEAHPDELALIQYSSGTTGEPRPVALTHAQVLANVDAILGELFAAHPEATLPPGVLHAGVSWLPLYHDMGLIGCVLVALRHPGDLTLIPPELFVADPTIWLRTLSRTRATISAAPNFAYALVAERATDAALAGLDLSAWKVALDGAEAVTAETLARFRARLAPHGFAPEALTPVYGLAEAALAVTFPTPAAPSRTLVVDAARLERDGVVAESPTGRSVVGLGRPLPGYAVRITGPLGAPLDERRIGAIEIAGPSIMQGYFGRDEATARVRCGPWLRTGDLGFVDQGQLFVTGRAKDVLIVRGRNHMPHELERAASAVPGVRRGCAVAFAVPGEATEQVVVLAERATRAAPDVDPAQIGPAIGRAVAEATGVVPDVVTLLAPGTLPRTSSGKLRRHEARRRFLAGELRAPAPVGLVRVLGELVRSRLAYARVALGLSAKRRRD